MSDISPDILALCGSPRLRGNTELLIDACLEGAKEDSLSGEKIWLNDLQISPCQACGGCQKTGQCVIQDDMQRLYPRLKQAKGIIVGSPVFFGSLTAQTKIVIDRTQCCWSAKYLLHEPLFPPEAKIPGVFLSVGGMNRYNFFQNAQQIIKIWFTILNINYLSELFCPGVDKRGEILQHSLAMQQANHLGKYLAATVHKKTSDRIGF